jgi:Sulfotransferase family
VSSGESRWPNLFVVGAGRCGTTTLWHHLRAHPDVFMAEMKEPFYFTRGRPGFQPIVDTEEDYLQLFRSAGDVRWVGEATPSYLRDPDVPGRLDAVSPEARAVAILRDPVERTWSSYWHARRYDIARGTFRELIDAAESDPEAHAWPLIRGSHYAGSVARFRSVFGERFLVLVFEEFFADLRAGLRGLYTWLDIDPAPANAAEPIVLNAYSRPRNRVATRFYSGRGVRYLAKRVIPVRYHHHLGRAALVHGGKPELDDDLRERLRRIFAADRERLEQELGRALPWPR